MQEELLGGGFLRHNAVFHKDDAVGHIAGKAHLMGDDHQRKSVGSQLGDGIQHLAGQLGVQRRGRLIEKQYLRPECDGPGDGHALLLPAGKLIRVKILPVEHPDLFQHLVCGLLRFGPVYAAGGNQPLQHILPDRHVAEKVEVLEHIAHLHPQGTDLIMAKLCNILFKVIKPDGAAVGLLQKADAPQQGGLAGPAAAQYRDDLPVVDTNVNALQHLGRAVAAMQILYFQHG